jgi:hypothetical protein
MIPSARTKPHEHRRDFVGGSDARSIIGRSDPLLRERRGGLGVDSTFVYHESRGRRPPSSTFATVGDAHGGLIERLSVIETA